MQAPSPSLTLHVLVADDDADMRLYVAGCLHVIGRFWVHEAADGHEALRLAQAHLPDLVISDVVMPELDGPALCRALKADAATAAIPFLLISGEASPASTEADGFLAKPFNALGLRAHVERLLART